MIAEPREVELWGAVCRVLSPPGAGRPSEWAERTVRLTREQSPRAGPYRCDWKPWLRALHDVRHESPEKRGLVALKRAQIGFTRAMLNVLAYECETRPGPFLFLISDARQAAHFAAEQFDPVVAASPRLAELFRVPGRRELTTERPFSGGRIDFAGAGSVSSVTSRTYLNVAIDEYEVFMDNFPAKAAGDGFTLAEARTQAFEAMAWVSAWSHPRREGEGIHALWSDSSDRRAWVFDCPHCETAIRPAWSLVRFGRTLEGDTIDPASAELRCPHCGEVVTDDERARAVWGPELGGTGRFESDLEPEEAARRPYVGISIHALADPEVTVRSLAERFVRAVSDRDRMAFANVVLGEPYRAAEAIVTEELVAERVESVDRIALPGGTWGARMLTVGVDVQAPEANPTLYVRASAWSPTGREHVVDLVKLAGWSALTGYLRELAVPIELDGRESGRLGALLCSIDCGAFTGQVLDFCRVPIVSEVNSRRVQLLPLRYQPHVKSTAPAIMPAESKRIDPTRPHLGAQVRYDLHRHSWVDRTLRRFSEGRVSILCDLPRDFAGHMTANVLAPVRDVHGWGNPGHEWSLIKGRRDDWMQAGAFNEAGAALVLGLDQLHEHAAASDAAAGRVKDEKGRSTGRGFVARARRGGSFWGSR